MAASVDAYLAGLPDDQRHALEQVRAVVRDDAPEAEERIAYGMPTYRYRGKPLVYFGAAKAHVALYGNNARFLDDEELAGLDHSKGTIRFTPAAPLDPAIIRKAVAGRMAEIDAGWMADMDT